MIRTAYILVIAFDSQIKLKKKTIIQLKRRFLRLLKSPLKVYINSSTTIIAPIAHPNVLKKSSMSREREAKNWSNFSLVLSNRSWFSLEDPAAVFQ